MDLTKKSSEKFAWKWTIKPEYIDEYIEMHLNPWPEVMDEHTKAVIRNYSIFNSGNEFFYCFECDNVKAAFDYMAKSEICAKWDSITEKMVDGGFEVGNELNSISFMSEIFYLK